MTRQAVLFPSISENPALRWSLPSAAICTFIFLSLLTQYADKNAPATHSVILLSLLISLLSLAGLFFRKSIAAAEVSSKLLVFTLPYLIAYLGYPKPAAYTVIGLMFALVVFWANSQEHHPVRSQAVIFLSFVPLGVLSGDLPFYYIGAIFITLMFGMISSPVRVLPVLPLLGITLLVALYIRDPIHQAIFYSTFLLVFRYFRSLNTDHHKVSFVYFVEEAIFFFWVYKIVDLTFGDDAVDWLIALIALIIYFISTFIDYRVYREQFAVPAFVVCFFGLDRFLATFISFDQLWAETAIRALNAIAISYSLRLLAIASESTFLRRAAKIVCLYALTILVLPGQSAYEEPMAATILLLVGIGVFQFSVFFSVQDLASDKESIWSHIFMPRDLVKIRHAWRSFNDALTRFPFGGFIVSYAQLVQRRLRGAFGASVAWNFSHYVILVSVILLILVIQQWALAVFTPDVWRNLLAFTKVEFPFGHEGSFERAIRIMSYFVFAAVAITSRAATNWEFMPKTGLVAILVGVMFELVVSLFQQSGIPIIIFVSCLATAIVFERVFETERKR